jgi:hypothetical protein
MRGSGRHQVPDRRKHLLLAILCIVLFLFGVTLQQTHSHPDGLTHSDCTICHTAPHVVQPVTPCQEHLGPIPSTRVVLAIEPVYPEHTFSFDHWNRPPPAGTAIA